MTTTLKQADFAVQVDAHVSQLKRAAVRAQAAGLDAAWAIATDDPDAPSLKTVGKLAAAAGWTLHYVVEIISLFRERLAALAGLKQCDEMMATLAEHDKAVDAAKAARDNCIAEYRAKLDTLNGALQAAERESVEAIRRERELRQMYERRLASTSGSQPETDLLADEAAILNIRWTEASKVAQTSLKQVREVERELNRGRNNPAAVGPRSIASLERRLHGLRSEATAACEDARQLHHAMNDKWAEYNRRRQESHYDLRNIRLD